MKETRRNQKVAAIGTGLVVESPTSTCCVSRGDRVIFFATNHPQKPTYVCVNIAFVARYSEKISECSGIFDPIKDFPSDLRAYVSWSRYSGVILDTVKIQEALNLLAKHLNIASESLQTSPTSSRAYTDHTVDKNAYDNRPTAVIFGLDNYAKTQIIPNIKNYLSLKRVHEIDPDQLLFFSDKTNIGLDTSPLPRDQTRYDAWFIAGYHHTHADLAITALKQDAYAVPESPLDLTDCIKLALDNSELRSSSQVTNLGIIQRRADYKMVMPEIRNFLASVITIKTSKHT